MRSRLVSSNPERRAVPITSRRAFLEGMVGAGLLRSRGANAEEPRFVPWRATPTPPLDLRDVVGRAHALADYRGQVVLINFWATWCDFCKEEIASIEKLRAQLARLPFTVLWVNYGQAAARVRDYAKNLSADVRVLLDPNQDAARAWSVRVIPSSFLIDAEGRVRYSVIGHLDWVSEEAVRTVRVLMP